MKYKKSFFITMIILLISQYAVSNENNSLNIEDLTIQVMPELDFPSQWPEDTPSLLVGYYGLFVNNLNRDFTEYITMPVPLGFPNFRINMICETEKGMTCLPYTIDKENNTIKWKLSRTLKAGEKMPFMIEYYSSPFEPGESKRFKLSPVFNSAINRITVDITHPARSTGFVMDPVPQNSITKNGSDHSILYYTNLEAGETIDLTISYIKDDNKGLVLDNNSNNSNIIQPKAETKPPGNTTLFIVIIISVTVAFLGLLIYLSSRTQSASRRQNRKKINSKHKITGTYESKKNKIRKLLLNDKISEKTYRQLLKDIPGPGTDNEKI